MAADRRLGQPENRPVPETVSSGPRRVSPILYSTTPNGRPRVMARHPWRAAGAGTQAARQGGGRRRYPCRGRGVHREGDRADGPVRDRPGAARGGQAGHRPAGQSHHRRGQPVVAGQGAPARRAGVSDPVRVRAAAADRAPAPGSTCSATPLTWSGPESFTPRC